MKKAILIIYSLLVACCSFGQQAPQWIYRLPVAGNQTYLYVCEQGIGLTQMEAMNVALARVFQSTANRIGQPFDSGKLNDALSRGTSLEVISQTYNIPINKVCEYAELLSNGNYRVYVLCQVASSGNVVPRWELFSQCYDKGGEERNGIALLKSTFVPGLGQIGKGHVGEGVMTLVGEVALIGGAVGCYYIAQDKLNVMRDPLVNYNDFTSARQTYNTCRTTNYILWGTAAGLYLFNLIRAVSMKPRYHDKIALIPSVHNNNNVFYTGISLTYNF